MFVHMFGNSPSTVFPTYNLRWTANIADRKSDVRKFIENDFNVETTIEMSESKRLLETAQDLLQFWQSIDDFYKED